MEEKQVGQGGHSTCQLQMLWGGPSWERPRAPCRGWSERELGKPGPGRGGRGGRPECGLGWAGERGLTAGLSMPPRGWFWGGGLCSPSRPIPTGATAPSEAGSPGQEVVLMHMRARVWGLTCLLDSSSVLRLFSSSSSGSSVSDSAMAMGTHTGSASPGAP